MTRRALHLAVAYELCVGAVALRSDSLSIQAKLVSHATERCEKNLWMTLDTCVSPVDDNTSYVITGDIDAMWIRDSTAQLWPYITLYEMKRKEEDWKPLGEESKDDKVLIQLRDLLHGALQRQAHFQLTDPYANAFTNKWESETDRRLGRGGYVFTGNYEVDSGTYFLKFLSKMVDLEMKDMGGKSQLMEKPIIREVVTMLVGVYREERDHALGKSDHKYPLSPPWELPGEDGQGAPAKYTGMVWGAFRPSDDAQTYPYNVPNNIFLAAMLGKVSALAEKHWEKSKALVEHMQDLRKSIVEGVKKYGVHQGDNGTSVYCYEVDGRGNCNLMDDANVPSLLSLPYLDPTQSTFDKELYYNTRAFVLSEKNPWYFKGENVAGIGSPHTGPDTIWPLSLVMQAMTATSQAEKNQVMAALQTVDPDQHGLSESVHKGDVTRVTRKWFAWPNSLFAEFLMKNHDGSCSPSIADLQGHLEKPKQTVSLTRGAGQGPAGSARLSRGSTSIDADRREGVVLPRPEYYSPAHGSQTF